MKQLNSFLRSACALIFGLFLSGTPFATNATDIATVRDALQSTGVSYGVAFTFAAILDDLNFTETDTIIDDSIYTGWGAGADFQLEFDGSDMLMTGIATVGLTIDLDSGSVGTETLDITAYNITLDATGNTLLIGNLDLNAVGGTDSPDLTLTDNSSGTLVILKPDASAATITSVTDGITITSAATKVLTLAADDASVNTENVVVISWAWGVDSSGNLLFDDDATDSPTTVWRDATEQTLTIYKPNGTAASIVASAGGVLISSTADNADVTLEAKGGSPDAGDDLVLDFHNFGLTDAGVITLNQSTTIGTVGDNETLTFQGQAGSPDAGDDIIFDFDNWALTALGVMSWPGNAGSITTKADTTFTITAGDDGADVGEDVIVVSESWGVDVNGNLLFDDDDGDSPTATWTDATAGTLVIHKPDGAAASIVSSTDGIIISSTEDDGDVTIQAQAGSPDAGDDLILDFDNFALDAAGAVTFPGQGGSIATKAATRLTLYGGDNGSDVGEDVVIVSESWGVDVNGDLLFDDDATDSPKATWRDETEETLVIYKPDGAAASIVSSHSGVVISSTEAAQTITIQGQAGSPGAGDDLVLDFHNIALTAAGVFTVPTTSKVNIVDDGAGLEFGGTPLAATVAELNDCDVDNRVTSSLFRMMIGQEKFTVLDAGTTTIYMAGVGAAFQVDAVSVCASGTLPIDAGGVTVVVARVSDSQSVLSGAIDLTTGEQTADQCTASGLNVTPANVDVGATDQLDIVVTTDGTVDTNGTEFTLTVWGSLD